MRLPSRLRLKESRDFAVIKAQGQSQSGRYFVLALLRDETMPDFRFGLVTGKRLGNAVVRNRLRRQIREIIRENRGLIAPGMKFVTIARWRAPDAEFAEMSQDWTRLARRMGLLLKTAAAKP
ncbi:ribonuclease P protein component [Brevifollis gellanilyticus]|uniref:Ribonuclease P protein component n=1 Tax=Brevifollis gellanilyticus TaxID=748831 RepID=A0A512MB54_9BACT|nr:ribonuclease P protein component [Brevifollis gellanilyticus]GEP43969.1 ribonuclease P protein component [Brevifollis gellanilyticus]